MKIYRLIPKEFYREFAVSTKLNQFLRAAFSMVENKNDCRELADQAESIRETLINIQPTIMNNVKDNVLRHLPLYFIRDGNRSGAKYLRWRNMGGKSTGDLVLHNTLNEPRIELPIKLNLISAERERLLFNVQMQLLTDFVQNFNRLAERFDELDKLEQEIVDKT